MIAHEGVRQHVHKGALGVRQVQCMGVHALARAHVSGAWAQALYPSSCFLGARLGLPHPNTCFLDIFFVKRFFGLIIKKNLRSIL